MTPFSERLRQVLDHYGISRYRLAKETTLSNVSLSNTLAGHNNPSYGFLCTLLERFPDVNANWLLMGQGTMFLDPEVKPIMVSHTSPDLLEAKNAVIASQAEIIQMKNEKIEMLTAELRGYKAAAELLKKEKTSDAVSPSNGK